MTMSRVLFFSWLAEWYKECLILNLKSFHFFFVYLFCQILSKSDTHANDLYKLCFGEIEEMNSVGRIAIRGNAFSDTRFQQGEEGEPWRNQEKQPKVISYPYSIL